jgi:hypothetical protein
VPRYLAAGASSSSFCLACPAGTYGGSSGALGEVGFLRAEICELEDQVAFLRMGGSGRGLREGDAAGCGSRMGGGIAALQGEHGAQGWRAVDRFCRTRVDLDSTADAGVQLELDYSESEAGPVNRSMGKAPYPFPPTTGMVDCLHMQW